MKNPVKTYSFWLKIIGAALLIALGVWLIVDINTGEKLATFIVLMFTGAAAGIFSGIRFIPLMRTLKGSQAKITCVVEVAIHVALAILMICGAVAKMGDGDSSFADFIYANYRYLIAFFFFTRIVSYFMCTVLFKEETSTLQFWVHILLIAASCIICAIAFEGRTIAWVFAILALACSLGLVIEGGIGYNRYRLSIAKSRMVEKEEKEEESPAEPLEMPSDEDIVIPLVDDEPQDSIHVN